MKITPRYFPRTVAISTTIADSIVLATRAVEGRFKTLRKGGRWVKTALKVAALGLAFFPVFLVEAALKIFNKRSIKKRISTQVEVDASILTPERKMILKREIELYINQEGLLGDKGALQNESQKLKETSAGIEKKLREDKVCRKEKRKLKRQLKSLSKEQTTLLKRIEKFEIRKEKHVKRVFGTYASTLNHYSPVVFDWVRSLLETALSGADMYNPPKKLVFLARDGIPAYEVAKLIREKYPNRYGKVDIVLLYLSRSVVIHAEGREKQGDAILLDYIKQEGIKKREQCIFVDIGFEGSMIQRVKNMLRNHTTNLEFAYLMSLTQNAHGFMANLETKLDSVPQAGGNRAIHWLEDTHQGQLKSPKMLERSKKDGKIYPNTLNPDNGAPISCKEDDPKGYLHKRWALQAILDYAKERTLQIPDEQSMRQRPNAWEMASEKMKVMFDYFLKLYRTGQRIAFVKH